MNPERGEFCRRHGFYGACPSCSGEEVVWEIPVVNYGVETGTLRVSAQGEPQVIGSLHMPWEGQATAPPVVRGGTLVRLPIEQQEAPRAAAPRAASRHRDHIPIGTNPGLLARVKLALGKEPSVEPDVT